MNEFAVVYEANADFLIATQLADRIFCESIAWLEPDLLDGQRMWIPQNPDGVPFEWKQIGELAFKAGIKASGHFEGEPGLPDALAARRAIRYLRVLFKELKKDLKGIILIRDQDNSPLRRKGLDQALNEVKDGFPIVVGLAVAKRECWIISGFEPRDGDEEEKNCLVALRAELGFQPHLESHKLTAIGDTGAKLCAKRVLRRLSNEDWNREQSCWMETPLETLRERGENNGLKQYLNEVQTILAPILG